MNYYDLVTNTVSSECVKLDEIELSRRLNTHTGYTNQTVQKISRELADIVNYKYVYTLVPIDIKDDYVNLGFTSVTSKSLSRNLCGCSCAIILATTIGIGVDRCLNKKSLLSTSELFFADALGSAYAESFCDYVNQMLGKEYKLKPRFSPGYGDLPIELQEPLLKTLCADKTVGITLDNSFLMTPVKSITAIIGVL